MLQQQGERCIVTDEAELKEGEKGDDHVFLSPLFTCKVCFCLFA